MITAALTRALLWLVVAGVSAFSAWSGVTLYGNSRESDGIALESARQKAAMAEVNQALYELNPKLAAAIDSAGADREQKVKDVLAAALEPTRVEVPVERVVEKIVPGPTKTVIKKVPGAGCGLPTDIIKQLNLIE